MSTSAITPDNPFDTPLPSEVQDHQQASAAKVAAGGNPFDEPLPSEKAEAQLKANPAEDASNTRQMLVSGLTGMPTPNMTEQDKASFERGKMAGAVSVPVVASAASSGPLLEAIGGHLTTIKSIIDAASKIGIGTLTYQEAKHLYKEFAEKK
jgi:hypothetical protein